MSIKIYEGYRMPMRSLPDLMAFLREFRDQSMLSIADVYHTHLVENAVSIIGEAGKDGHNFFTVDTNTGAETKKDLVFDNCKRDQICN